MFDKVYEKPEPAREQVDAWAGPAVLEFGTDWCEICQGTQTMLRQVFSEFGGVHHLKISDGKGKPLGRSFRVKLWPTLIYLKDGKEVARSVRPTNEEDVRSGLRAITE